MLYNITRKGFFGIFIVIRHLHLLSEEGENNNRKMFGKCRDNVPTFYLLVKEITVLNQSLQLSKQCFGFSISLNFKCPYPVYKSRAVSEWSTRRWCVVVQQCSSYYYLDNKFEATTLGSAHVGQSALKIAK